LRIASGELKKPGIITEKSYAFALTIISLARAIRKQGEYELASQLIRSGTSIGANVEEAQNGFSRADFIAKIGIALKEAGETRYWLRLLRDSHLSPKDTISQAILDVEELHRILASIVKTSREKTPPRLSILHPQLSTKRLRS
jgi:four helix bundle protein